MRDQGLLAALSGLAGLIPGDHIHAVAPLNLSPASAAVTQQVLAGAHDKRARRAARNRALTAKAQA